MRLRSVAIMISLAVTVVSICSCTSRTSGERYSLNVRVANPLQADSVTLYIYEPNYNMMKQLARTEVDNHIVFTGVIDAPEVCALQLNSDSLSYCFLLDGMPANVEIGGGVMRYHGGNTETHKYIATLNKVKSLKSSRASAIKLYNELVDSSAMTIEIEKRLLGSIKSYENTIDSIVSKYASDSLQFAPLLRYKISKL